MNPQFIQSRQIIGQDHQQQMVKRYVRALTSDASAIEDLTQEVFLRAIQRIDRLYTPSSASAYLRGIARFVVKEHHRAIRQRQRCSKPLPDDLFDPQMPAEHKFIQAEEAEATWDAINDLPLIARRIFEMRYLEDLNATQIGQALNIKPPAVRATLSRIRQRIRARANAYSNTRSVIQ